MIKGTSLRSLPTQSYKRATINLGFVRRPAMAEGDQTNGSKMEEDRKVQGTSLIQNTRSPSRKREENSISAEAKDWAMEVYKGQDEKPGQHAHEGEEILELDMEEEED
jgi:hypothetical protein